MLRGKVRSRRQDLSPGGRVTVRGLTQAESTPHVKELGRLGQLRKRAAASRTVLVLKKIEGRPNVWKAVKDKQGQHWLIDWQQFNNVIAAYAFMQAFKDCARIKTEKIDWGFDIDTVDFDHSKMMHKKQSYINRLVGENVRQLGVDGREVFKNLVEYRGATATMRRDRAKLFAKAQSSANSSLAWAEAALATTQLTRDVAISAIAIVGIPAEGGVAIAAVAANTAGTAIAKYQDTGNADAAIIAGTGALIMCGAGAVTEIAKEGQAAMNAGAKVMVVGGLVIDTMFEYAGALAEKKSTGDAGKAALLKAVMSSVGLGIDSSPLAKKFGKQLEDHFEEIEGKILAQGKYYVDGMKAAAGVSSVEGTKKGLEKAAGMYVESKPKKRQSFRQIDSRPMAPFIAGKVLQPITIR